MFNDVYQYYFEQYYITDFAFLIAALTWFKIELSLSDVTLEELFDSVILLCDLSIHLLLQYSIIILPQLFIVGCISYCSSKMVSDSLTQLLAIKMITIIKDKVVAFWFTFSISKEAICFAFSLFRFLTYNQDSHIKEA